MKPHTVMAGLALWLAAPLAQADAITLLGPDQIAWDATPEGVSFAALEGDRFSESYQALVRLPSGTISPPHMKSASMFGVMLEGEMIHYLAGGDPEAATRIGPGSYYKIDAGVAHVSACVSEIECVTYLYQDGAFDFLPVQP